AAHPATDGRPSRRRFADTIARRCRIAMKQRLRNCGASGQACCRSDRRVPMAEHYDALETRDPAERERALMTALAAQIEHAQKNTAYYAEALRGVVAGDVSSRLALSQLPLTRKSSLGAAQKAKPPFGGLLAVPVADLAHVFMSPGPIF